MVYRMRILESNPAGYWEFFGFDIVPLRPDPDYPNEINCDHRKNLKWIHSFVKKNTLFPNDIG